ncbi:MAG: hypothetical protein ABSF17_07440 [Terracidiphilus sp.]|jgi:hypothetical protein
MPYSTRVLSQEEDFPSFEDLAAFVRDGHPDCKLTLESGDAQDWESLLLATTDEVEIAVLERNPVDDGSTGQDEIADLLEDMQDCKPESSVQWLDGFLSEVKTVYTFQHLQGAETVDGGNALHALRSHLWERGDAILQADGEGFTNEEGYHILWQFSDDVSGPWNMGVYKDDLWHHFKMDLGDPGHRAAFLAGEVPDDLTGVHAAIPRRD